MNDCLCHRATQFNHHLVSVFFFDAIAPFSDIHFQIPLSVFFHIYSFCEFISSRSFEYQKYVANFNNSNRTSECVVKFSCGSRELHEIWWQPWTAEMSGFHNLEEILIIIIVILMGRRRRSWLGLFVFSPIANGMVVRPQMVAKRMCRGQVAGHRVCEHKWKARLS